MKILTFFFIASLVIFFTILTLVHFQIDFPNWIRFYVNDLLCMPVVLFVCLKVVHFVKKDTSIRLSLFSVLSLTIFYSVYFEVYLPKVNERYTGDWLDVVMYFSGALVFYFLQHKK